MTEQYVFLCPTLAIPGIERCKRPREQAEALTAHLRASLGDKHEITLERSRAPAGLRQKKFTTITPSQFVDGSWNPRRRQWGWAIITPSKETAALLKLFFPGLIEKTNTKDG